MDNNNNNMGLNFLAECDPDLSHINSFLYVYVEKMHRGTPVTSPSPDCLSFSSGHSSFGMFLVLYLQAGIALPQVGMASGPTVQFFLLVFAPFVGYSHVSDHKHHSSDVLINFL